MKGGVMKKSTLFLTSVFLLGTFFLESVEAQNGSVCLEDNLPPWLDWRTEEAKANHFRERLLKSPVRTALVVIGALLIVLLNALLCFLLYKDGSFWSQRTYRMIFSLAVNDCLTGVLLLIGVLTEIESVQKMIGELGCKLVIAGLWLCVTTSIYTFTVISVARWLMLNHPRFYNKQFQDKPIWTSYIGIAACWVAGAIHAIPLLTEWNDECVTDFQTCSLPYKSPVWIWATAFTVFIIPTMIIVTVYSLTLWKMQAKDREGELADKVTKTLSILTAAFLLVWWPLCIFLSVKWNREGGTRGFYAGAISCLVNPILLICLNEKLKEKVVKLVRNVKCNNEE